VQNFISFRCLVICLSICVPGYAESSRNLAEELAKLRAETEELSDAISLARSSLVEEATADAARKSELESELQREELRVQRLTAMQREFLSNQQAARAAETTLIPVLRDTLDEMEHHVKTGLPFHIAERAAAISDLRQKLDAASLLPSKAAPRVWGLLQDELRLTRENGLYRQPISLDGEEILADVVRLGMVMMYFQVNDTEVGQAVQTNQGWKFTRVIDPQEANLIRQLFDSFRRQVRVGLFALPANLQLENHP
jgi:hypothetical protein